MIATVYRNIERRQEFIGLEFVDALVVAVVLWAVMMFHQGHFFVNAAIVGACFGALKLYKRGKPRGYTTALFRFGARIVLRRATLSAATADTQTRPFPF